MAYRRIAALPLLVLLTACGSGSEDSSRASLVPSAFETAANCMLVHAAILQAGFAPLGISGDVPDADEIIEGLHATADTLPLDDTGQPTLRNAFHGIADQVAGIRGQGADAAGALAQSAPYRADVDVLGAWSRVHCDKSGGGEPPTP